MSTRREFLRLMGLSAAAAATLTLWPGITHAT
ncbi:MAG: twin-arginine translocation signal domain-containing protein, partial [Metallibacterium sp.]